MSSPVRVAVIVGSLRAESISRRFALALAAAAPEPLELSVLEIGDLPHYNQDLEASPPAPWTAFRAALKAADALLFVVPEYNRSIPGVVKNAIDVGSRPWGQNAWNGIPAAVVSLSQGLLGGLGANHHLRQCLMPLGVPAMPTPEAYLSQAADVLDASGAFRKPEQKAYYDQFLAAFATWIGRNRKA